MLLAFLAGACGRAGQWDEGLRRVDEGIAFSETTPVGVHAAELWRVKGELLLGKGRLATRRPQRAGSGSLVDAARRCFRQALEIARSQEARSLELRAVMSLARLSAWRGASRDARTLLRPLFASFTEGLDTKDLQDAKALLDGLEPWSLRSRRARS